MPSVSVLTSCPPATDQSTTRTGFRHRPDIDGLRSLAIIPVLLFHAGLGFSGGFVGVDVFFVISGFLIGGILQADVDAGRFSLATFWERRIRRLVPAMMVVLLATLVAGYVILLPWDFRELAQSAIMQQLFAANFYFWRESGYFAGPSELKPLLHTWSLAVEEQFYLFLPPLMLVRSSQWRRCILVGLFVLSFGWSVISVREYPQAACYLLPSRAWELLLGVLLAQFLPRRPIANWLAGVLSVGGLLLIAWSAWVYDGRMAFPGPAALAPCLGAAGLIAGGLASPLPFVNRVLSTRPLVWVGQLSYSLYLWHWPLFSYANYLRIQPLSAGQRLGLLAASFVLAVITWAFIEQPCRRGPVGITRRTVFASALAVSVAMLGLNGLVVINKGVPSRFPESVLTAANSRSDRNPRRRDTDDLPASRLAVQLPRLGDPRDERPPVLALIGDSHADALIPLFDEMCRSADIPAVCATRPATVPLLGESREVGSRPGTFLDVVFSQIASLPSVEHVVLVARWSKYRDRLLNAESLQRTIDELHRHGKKVWLLRQVPEQPIESPRGLALALAWNRNPTAIACSRDEYEQQQARVDALFEAVADASTVILDPTTVFFPEGNPVCRVGCDGRAWYIDRHHLGNLGGRQLASMFAPLFQDVLSRDRPRSGVYGHRQGAGYYSD